MSGNFPILFAFFLALSLSLLFGYLIKLRISVRRMNWAIREMKRMAVQMEADLEKVEEEKKALQAVLFGMVEGVMVTDKDGKIILVNPAFQELFDVQKAPTGKTPLELLRNRGIQDLVEEASRNPSILVEQEVALSGGNAKTFLAHAMALLDKDALERIICVFYDITHLKKLESLRRDFVANVSHELKTPLTSIHGYAETLLGGALKDPSHAKEFTQIIYEQSGRLGRLIDDLLDLSKIESGRMDLQLAPIDLSGLIQEGIRQVTPAAEKKNLVLQNNVPRGLSIKADLSKARQIFMNLLDNAVKYTPGKGTVRITANSSSGQVEVKIQDTGIGIPEKELPRLFERFYRVDKARSRELGGTGLGLAIVKHLIQAHGGKVWVESVPGKGSSFYVTFQAAP